jgi:hypothetical protein
MNTSTVTSAYETTTSRLKSVTDVASQIKTYSYAKDDRLTASPPPVPSIPRHLQADSLLRRPACLHTSTEYRNLLPSIERRSNP